MELIFINMGIIVFFLIWAFILISKSFSVEIEDKDEAWKKYQASRIKRMQYKKNTNTRH